MKTSMKTRLSEILRFALTGGVCFLIEYAALVLFKEWLHMNVLIATPLAFLISVIVNYLMCVRWVFSGAQEGSRKAQIGFVITSGIGLLLNWAIMALLTALFGEDTVLFSLFGLSVKVYMINKVIATLLVMIWNYITKRMLLKRK
ncbi:MAG: GtrA family protein [Clostridiales bacterium]|nr:GtrA family protein [Clostridiales bacterium]